MLKWKLKVENFGKIKSACIEPSPLMIFLGDNNSGKSYLMSLIWGLMKNYTHIFLKEDNYKLESYKNLEEVIDNVLETDSEDNIDNFFRLYEKFLNEILALNKDFLVKEIFNKEIQIDKLEIILLKSQKYDEIFCNLRKKSKKESHYLALLKKYTGDMSLLLEFAEGGLIDEYIRNFGLLKYFNLKSPLFLPASRTGFMLTYKTLLNESINNAFGSNNEQNSRFTKPIIDFLNKFVNLGTENNINNKEIVEFLEQNLLQGRIIKDQSPIKNISYKPKNMDNDLPLYLTSSLVTEVAPFALFLNDKDYKTVMIEEPEAHLHLKAQIIMARAISMLVNKNTNVWLTTHSDTFLQQINNLIKLNNHPKKEELLNKFGFKENEILDFNDVRVYEFEIKDGQTTVTNIKGSNEGFPTPTFNDVLYKLTNEMLDLEEDYDD
ncbi:MAG: AAA family ATPase [Peptostreptococcaceae bacterium]|jgi:predicted ATPase|nr:AAA family ATPase [Peptostreptococcaceae bacterium]